MKIININCRFCDAPMGQQTLPNVEPLAVVTLDDIKILDARCDTCGPLYGNFKEMSMFYNDNVSEDAQTQKDFFTKSEYKIDKYVDNMIFDHPEAIFGGGVTNGDLKDTRDSKVVALGLSELGDTEKIEAINTYKQTYGSDTEIDTEKITTIKEEIINNREE